ncbi:hypothetical protein CsatB_027261 [Cannabis sativa]
METSGIFSVKSAYKHLQSAHGNWSIMDDVSSWIKLWKLEVPPKVLHFLWRAISGCLPTKVQLQTKYVNVDLHCPFCLNSYETISHVLMECQFARSCWNLASSSVVHGFNHDYSSWFFKVLDSNSAKVSADAAMQWSAAHSQKLGPLLVFGSHTGLELWKKPLSNSIKVNMDGAIFATEHKYGFVLCGTWSLWEIN